MNVTTDDDYYYYYLDDDVCFTEWTNDNWCDGNCNRAECNFDGNACGCDTQRECAHAYGYIMIGLSGASDPFELIVLDDICTYWDTIKGISGFESFTNCTAAFALGDINNNGYLGFREAIIIAASAWGFDDSIRSQIKLHQIDCSTCMENSSLWDW